MATTQKPAAESVLGRSPDQLTLEERHALAGNYIALQVYTPAEVPLRRIEAIGDSVEQCVATLRRRGLDPLKFEFSPLKPAY
jgi:hypothetical protein